MASKNIVKNRGNVKVKASIYMKNVGRSLARASGDVFSQYMPTVASVGRTSSQAARTAKDSIKKIKDGNISASVKDFLNADESILTNLLDDLKTGNWYNTERDDNLLDFDIDYEDEDWGDDEESSSATDQMIAHNDNNSKQIINSMGNMSTSISKSFGKVSAKSAEYIVSNVTAGQRALYDLNRTGFNQITGVLLNMNNSIDTLVKLGEPMLIHMKESSQFYAQTSNTLNEINENLGKIAKRTEFMEVGPGGKSKDSNFFGKIMFGKDFDMEEYMEMVKENFKASTSMFSMLGSMGKTMAGKYGKNISPMQYITTGLIEKMIPKVIKESTEAFNESLGNAIVTGMARGRKAANKKGGIASLLASIFLPPEENMKYNKSNYNKGNISWDGIARKSLVEVIPTYLAKIYAALGGEEKYYNFEKGKFESLDIMRKARELEEKAYANKAAGDFRTYVSRNVDSAGYRGSDAEQLKKEIDNFYLMAFRTGLDFYEIEDRLNDKKFLEGMGISKRAANMIAYSIKTARQSASRGERSLYSNFQANVYRERGNYAQNMRNREANGYSNDMYFESGFENATRFSTGNNRGNRSNNRRRGTRSTGGERSNFNAGRRVVFNGKSEDQLTDAEWRAWQAGLTEDEYEKSSKKQQDREQASLDSKIKGQKLSEDDETTSWIKDFFKKQKEKFGQTKIGSAMSRFKSIIDAKMKDENSIFYGPAITISNFIDKLTSGINDLFWGSDGVLKKLKTGFKDFFDNIKKKIWDSEPMKKVRGVIRGTWEDTKDEFKNLTHKVGMKYSPSYRERYIGGIRRVAEEYKQQQAASEWEAHQEAYDNYLPEGSGSGLRRFSGGDSGTENNNKKNSLAGSMIKDGATTLYSGIKEFMNRTLLGDNPDKEKEKVLKSISDTMGKMKEYRGAMTLGGLAGAGVSLLTGAVVGPIAGAAIGAGVGYLAKTGKLSKWLFGDFDEQGNRKGGIISKETQDKVSDFIKGHVPNITAGAIAGLIAGPFGLAGNILLGSTVGYLTTTNKFKDIILGKEENGKRTGGLAGSLHDKIIKPIDSIMHNLGKSFTGFFKRLNKNMQNIFDHFKNRLAKQVDNITKNNKFLRGARKVVKALNPVNMIGWGLGKIDKGIKAHNLRKGYGVYDEDLGRDLDAKERMQLREDMLNHWSMKVNPAKRALFLERQQKFGALDQELAGMNEDEIKEFSKTLKSLQDRKNNRAEIHKDTLNKMMSDLNGFNSKDNIKIDAKTREKLAKYVAEGDQKSIDKLLNKLPQDLWEEANKIVYGAKNKIDNAEDDFINQNKTLKTLKEKGMRFHGSDFVSAIDLTEKELGSSRFSEEEKAKREEEKEKDRFHDWQWTIAGALSKIANTIKTLAGETRDFMCTGVFRSATLNSTGESIQDMIEDANDENKDSDNNNDSDDGLFNIADRFKNNDSDSAAGSKLKRLFGGDSGNEDNKVVSKIDALGLVHQYTENNQGELTEVTNDKETKSSRDTINKFTESINFLPMIGKAMSGVKGLLGSLKDKLLGNKDEKKEGWLSKLFKGLFGDDGLLGALIGDNGILGAIRGFFSGGGLTAAITAALVGFSLTGTFDGIMDRLSKKIKLLGGNDTSSHGTIADTTAYDAQDSEGNNIHFNSMEELQEAVKSGEIDSSTIKTNGRDTSWSTQLKKNFANGLLMGHGSVVTKTFSNLGKKVKPIFSATKNAAVKGGSAAKKTAEAIKNFGTKAAAKSKKAGGAAKNFLSKRFGKEVAEEGLEKAGKELIENAGEAAAKDAKGIIINAIDDITPTAIKAAEGVASKIPMFGKIMGTKGGQAIAKIFEKIKDFVLKKVSAAKAAFVVGSEVFEDALIVIKVAYVILRGVEGWYNASSTLGIIDEPTESQKSISALIAIVNSLVPYIGDLIPDNVFVNIFVEVCKMFKLDTEDGSISKLMDQREKANEIVSKYNEETGRDLSIRDYNIEHGNSGFWTMVGYKGKNAITKFKAEGGFKGVGQKISAKATDIKDSIGDTVKGFTGSIKNGITSVFDSTKSIFDKFKQNATKDFQKITSMNKKFSDLAKEGKVKEIWDYKEDTLSKGNPLNGLFSNITTVSKLFNTVVGVFHKLSEPAKTLVERVKKGIKEGIIDPLTNLKNTAKEKWDNFWNNDDSTADSGGGSFVSQYDPKYQNYRIHGNTFADKGCGPAVAAMAAGIPVSSAMRASKGYQNNAGVSMDYFADVMASRGMRPRLISGGSSQDLYSNIAKGKKTVLLGRDPYNTSKRYSPFGPGNHYVLATGIDRRGNVIVNDPELGKPRAYNPAILNSVSYGMSGGGSAQDISDIWGFLKSKGLNEYAAAGLMGCWDNESSISPDTLEGNYYFKEDQNRIMSDNNLMNDYTRKVWSFHKVGSKGQQDYYGTDGNLYPGYGLAQWTGPRQQKLINFARETGRDHRNLATQLDYFWSEYEDRPALQSSLANANSIESGTIAALDNYEMYSNWHTTSKGQKQLSDRLVSANKIYNEMSGKPGTVPNSVRNGRDRGYDSSMAGDGKGWEDNKYNTAKVSTSATNPSERGFPSSTAGYNTGVSGSTGSTNGTSSGSNGTGKTGGVKGWFSGILSAFTNAFGKLFSGTDDEESSSSTSSTTSTSTSSSGNNTATSLANYAGTGDYETVYDVKNREVDPLQQALVDKMKSIEGQINYSMNGARDPDKGSADCSSTVNWAYRNVLGCNIGNDTLAIMKCGDLITVDKSDIPRSGGDRGSGINIDKLMPGDVILFSRPNSSGYNNGRPYLVGHVGMYMGNGQMIHHNNGKGPKVKQLNNYDNRTYIMARRHKKFVSGIGGYTNYFDDRGFPTSTPNYVKYNSIKKPSDIVTNTNNKSGSYVPNLGKSNFRDEAYPTSIDTSYNSNAAINAGKNLGLKQYTSKEDKIGNYMNSKSGGASGVNDIISSKQQALVDKMVSIKGTLDYDQKGPRDPDQGSADCSSTVGWAYKKILGVDPGSYTEAIMYNDNLVTIDESDMPKQGGTSSGPDISKLQPGDLVLLTRDGPKNTFTVGRPYRIGHVEMYMGNGQTIGHGKDGGPTIKPIEKNKYIMARRYKGFMNGETGLDMADRGFSSSDAGFGVGYNTYTEKKNLTAKGFTDSTSAAGSGLLSFNDYGTLAKVSGGSSGLLIGARPGSRNNYVVNPRNGKLVSLKNISGGDGMFDSISTLASNVQQRISTNVKKLNNEELLLNIAQCVIDISNNTKYNAKIEDIVNILKSYLSTRPSGGDSGLESNDVKVIKKSNNTKEQASIFNEENEVDNHIRALAGVLAELAKG